MRLRARSVLMGLVVGCGQVAALPEQAATFQPAWWCPGPHAQTIWGALLRPASMPPIERERWDTPDRDFLDIDQVAAAAGSPTLIVLHGLESSSASTQVRSLLEAAHHRGWRGIAVNFRSCSGTPNRLRRSYHAGETSDVAWVVNHVIARYPGDPIFCVGLSLGGNVLLKYVGEQGAALPSDVKAVAAISTPFDLAVSAHAFERGLFNRIYMRRLVRSLKQKTIAKLEQYPDLADRQRLMAVTALAEFDELVTAPVHGFANAAAYWEASTARPWLSSIQRPTLLINAQDDPLLPAQLLPRDDVAQNRYLTALFPAHGGHLGFLTGGWPGRPVRWAEQQAMAFFEQHLGL